MLAGQRPRGEECARAGQDRLVDRTTAGISGRVRAGRGVGLYLNPPERAVVFSFDEKTQCQALDRTQPSLPMKPGRAGTMTHDYKRHGTIDLFAAMNVAPGEVLTDLRKGHTRGRCIEVLQADRRQCPSRAGCSRRPGQPVRALDA